MPNLMKIIQLPQIKNIIKSINIIPEIEQGFVTYSQGKTVIPPVGELIFHDPPGDVHIKYGYILHDNCYVIKIGSGFYENPQIGLPSSNGLMLLFNKQTGQLLSILLDEGYLTDIRTAAAGAVFAKYLAPKKINRVGIVGTGTQAKHQLGYLNHTVSCNDVIVFGRNLDRLLQFKLDMRSSGLNIQVTQEIEDITSTCNFIITTTPATTPLLFANQIKKGTHITAVGADSSHKQELDENIFSIADLIVADSVTQCIERGDISHAIKKKLIKAENISEIGDIIVGKRMARTNDDQITVADLTGLAIQDIQIAKAVYNYD